MTAIVIHLSDIHLQSEQDPVFTRAQQIAAATYSSLVSATAVFLVVSGDIANRGSAAEFAVALRFLRTIQHFIKLEKDIPTHILPSAGNHDCDFTKDSKARRLLLASVQREGLESIDDSVLEGCTPVLSSFFDFEREATSTVVDIKGDDLWKTYHFEVEGRSLAFDAINVAWCSTIHEKQGAMLFPHSRYSSKAAERPDLRVSFLHHPFNWFNQPTFRPFRDMLRAMSNVIMTGHEHVGAVGEVLDSSSGHSAYVEGWVLQEHGDSSSSAFGIVELDVTENRYRASKLEWNGLCYEKVGCGSWQSYRKIPGKLKKPMGVSDMFSAVLRDPGANFKSALGSEVTLSDLFVYPDMQSLEEGGAREIRRASVLSNMLTIQDGPVFLTGEERIGATSLLRQLFESHHADGRIPLILNGQGLRSGTEETLESIISDAVELQYGPAALTFFTQTPRAKRILFIDGLDRSPIRATTHIAKMLSALAERFGAMVITVSDIFNLRDLVFSPEQSFGEKVRRYQILPFGYARRAELIRKWYQISTKDGTLSDTEVLDRCSKAERSFDSVMLRNVVPTLPLYLLVLLQGLDAGTDGSFQESGLGRYYGFLLEEGLRSAGVAPSQWERIIDYLGHLSWHFHRNRAIELSSGELKRFTSEFSRTEHDVDFESRLADLLRAKILRESAGEISFRYPYLYYYAKGHYLSRKLDEDSTRNYIRHCWAHPYTRENSNTLLFAAHHASGSKFFVDCVVAAANSLFPETLESRFDSLDTTEVAELIISAPQLKYTGQAPEAFKNQENEDRDNEPVRDDLAEEEEFGELSLSTRTTATLKTIEIIGQMLKNQYSGLNRAKRVELLEQALRGPLRAINAVFTAVAANPAGLLGSLETQIAEKSKELVPEERARTARKIMAYLLQAHALGFVLKASTSVSAKDLLEDVQTAVGRLGSPAAKMIELASRMDGPGPIPRALVKSIQEDMKSDVVGSKLLQLITLRRLYMFKIKFEDKQWLESRGIVKLSQLGAAALVAQERKLLRVKGH